MKLHKKLHKEYEDYIKYSKRGALQLIVDLSVNYDGYNTVPSLKTFIDELRDIALLGLKQKEKGDNMKNKATVEDIRKAVKILEKHKIKLDEDLVIEVEKPSELYDFLKDVKPSPRYTRGIRNIIE